jgi:hypothetical protein|nr:MAG TPA: hypothetical protein [Caudoviricetes sp.]
MRKAIFLAIADALCPENPADPNADTSKNIVPYVDLWNDQVNLLGGSTAFETPAVFVEFEQIDWKQQNAGARRGDIPVRLHIVTRAVAAHGVHDQRMGDVLAVFDLINAINAKMQGLRGEGFAGFQLTTSATNHNHAELVENVERLVTSAQDCTGMRQISRAIGVTATINAHK